MPSKSYAERKPRRRFTPDEDALLKELWETELDHERIYAALPNRDKAIVRNRACKLGISRLTRPHPWCPVAYPMSEIDAAWLAGFIDGEGCLGLYRSAGSFRASLSVVNTDLRAIHRVMAITGTTSCSIKPAVIGHRKAYLWFASRQSTISSLLLAIRPYLVVKGDQADKLFRYYQLRHSPRPHSDAVKAEIGLIFEAMKMLKRVDASPVHHDGH